MTDTNMTANHTRFNHVLAFEVSKAELVVYSLPGGTCTSIANGRAEVRRRIKKEIAANVQLCDGPLLIICEATGGYERHVLDAATELGVACHRAHGSRIRAYARYRGTHAKSDAIDVRLIAEYGRESQNLRLYELPGENQSKLRALIGRRADLMASIEAETNKLEQETCRDVIACIAAVVRVLERQLKKIDQCLDSLIAGDPLFRNRFRLMRSVKGIGRVTAASVLAYLPEIGSVSRGAIAALAGLAPFDQDSGTIKGARHIFAGRSQVRRPLYMAATVAMRHNSFLKAFAERIMAKGKSFKIAATAVMRKLLVILNGIIASNQPWRLADTA